MPNLNVFALPPAGCGVKGQIWNFSIAPPTGHGTEQHPGAEHQSLHRCLVLAIPHLSTSTTARTHYGLPARQHLPSLLGLGRVLWLRSSHTM